MKLLVSETSRHLSAEFPESDPACPRDWFDVLKCVAMRLGGGAPQRLTWRSLVGSRRHQLILAWQPSGLVAAATALGQRVIYLCWGLPSPSSKWVNAIKVARLRSILLRSAAIVVNEPVTKGDVARLCGRDATIIPYVVDGDFYQYGRPSDRADFLLVPGSNDRNERLVSQIAAAVGMRVIRVTQSPAVLAIHSGSNVEVRFNIAHAELATLYKHARCVLLPIASTHHAAGQTVILEAVACGAPVLVSNGRASSLGTKFPGVIIPPSEMPDDWVGAIGQAEQMLSTKSPLLLQGAEQIRREHSPDVVADDLLNLLLGLAGSCRSS